MLYLLLGALLLGCLWLMVQAFLAADPKTLAARGKWVVGGGLGLIAGYFAFRGYFAAMAGAVGAVMALFVKWRELWHRRFPPRQASPSGAPGSTAGSSLDTAFLRVALDHATGRMTGEVIAGRLQGRRLEDLAMAEAVALMGEAQADPATVQVLESFLDREHPGWRATAEPPPAAADSGAMSREEALKILDLAEGASPEEIRDAHRRLMMSNHPDHGGSTYLAAQINRAKDTLLG